MASKVYYAPFGEDETEESICRKTRLAFGEAGLDAAVAGGRLTAVKTHFGEKGNTTYIPPAFVKAAVDEVRAAGGRPFLAETSTLYSGQRSNALDHFNTAVEHGFGPEAMGCPLLFLDGLRGNLHVERTVGLKHFDAVAMAGDFAFVEAAVVLTHLTGHPGAGLGGALKNVAMGLSSRAGKLRLHADGRPEPDESKCTACGSCVEWCPEDAIRLDKVARVDMERCIGCGECVAVCPVEAMDFSWVEKATVFNEKMVEYGYGILKGILGRVGFITFIHRVTKQCNCVGAKGTIVCPDLGILASRDLVAVEQATVDLVNEAHGGDLFEELFPGSHYDVQLSYGEEVGLGSRRYELVTL